MSDVDVPLEIARIVVALPNGGSMVGYGLRYEDQDSAQFREVVAKTSESMRQKACAAPSEVLVEIVNREEHPLPFLMASLEFMRASMKEEVYHKESVPYGEAPHLPEVPDRFKTGGRPIPESEIN